MKKIGICLAGGGARGVAHIGVLRALEENNIRPDYVSGASMGAIVGAMYADGLSTERMMSALLETKIYKLFTFGVPWDGLTELKYLQKMLKKYISATRFEDLKKKLFVAISNLNTGQAEIHSIGELRQIVLASSCIPLIFKPIEIGNYTYVDGGLLNNLPVEPLLDISEVIIGVNVNGNNILDNENWNLKTIAERSFDLVMWTNASQNLKKCHIIIEPSETTNHNLFDFGAAKQIYQYGYDETKRLMPEILKLV